MKKLLNGVLAKMTETEITEREKSKAECRMQSIPPTETERLEAVSLELSKR